MELPDTSPEYSNISHPDQHPDQPYPLSPYHFSNQSRTPYFTPGFSIVWTPIPCLSALIPWIGHVGVVDLEGNCFDFAGPYTITYNDLAFGVPHKYHRLETKQIEGFAAPEAPALAGNRDDEDSRGNGANGGVSEYIKEALLQSSKKYSTKMHNLIFNNCHSYIADFLNRIGYRGANNWNQVSVFFLITFKSKYVSCYRAFRTYLWFMVCVLVIIICVVMGVTL